MNALEWAFQNGALPGSPGLMTLRASFLEASLSAVQSAPEAHVATTIAPDNIDNLPHFFIAKHFPFEAPYLKLNVMPFGVRLTLIAAFDSLEIFVRESNPDALETLAVRSIAIAERSVVSQNPPDVASVCPAKSPRSLYVADEATTTAVVAQTIKAKNIFFFMSTTPFFMLNKA